MDYNHTARAIIGTSIDLHKNLDPGLLESAYEMALAFELEQLGFAACQQVPMPFIYKGNKLEVGYRVNLIVDDKILLEIKSVDNLNPVHFAQTLTYLKISQIKLGLLINFNVKLLKDGIHRIVNNFSD